MLVFVVIKASNLENKIWLLRTETNSNQLFCKNLDVKLSHLFLVHLAPFSIFNKEEWLCRPANIKGANIEFKLYVGRSMTVYSLFLLIYYA